MKKTIALASLVAAVVLLVCSCASVSKDWEWACGRDHIWSYQDFLKKYPDSKYTSEAKAAIASIIKVDWLKVSRVEKAYKYEKFIRKYEDFPRDYPESEYVDKVSEYVDKAKERLSWQRANRAIVQIDYPEYVRQDVSLFRSEYSWNTIFKETGGKSGFKLKANDWIIRDSNDETWTSRSSDRWDYSVKVKPNGKASVKFGFSGDTFAGGYFYTTWRGEDYWGNLISIEQKIEFYK